MYFFNPPVLQSHAKMVYMQALVRPLTTLLTHLFAKIDFLSCYFAPAAKGDPEEGATFHYSFFL